MATHELPRPVTSNETHRVSLEGVTYQLTWRWNDRDSHWALSIAQQEGDPIISGLRVVVGFDLLLSLVADVRPPGAIFILDQSVSSGGTDPGLEDLYEGGRCVPYYMDVADVEAARA